jgi:hypothetical protein
MVGQSPHLPGAFEALQTWDPRGYVVDMTYRDEKGDVTRVEDGCAGRRMHYDDLGNLAEYACLNERGAETITTAGYALVRSTYDVSGNELTTSLFTAPGMPGVVGDTYESIRRTYTLFGKVEKETYLDAKGVQVNVRQGFAAVTHEYDSRGNEVTTRYWDTHGDVAPGVNGCAAIRPGVRRAGPRDREHLSGRQRQARSQRRRIRDTATRLRPARVHRTHPLVRGEWTTIERPRGLFVGTDQAQRRSAT